MTHILPSDAPLRAAFLTALLLTAPFLGIGCESPTPAPDDDDSAVAVDDDDDDDSTAEPLPSAATVGSEGGQVALTDGTGVAVPPDAWSDPLEVADVVIEETEPGEFPESDLWDPLGTAFTLSPPMGSEDEPFRVYVPLGAIEKSQSWEDARLMLWQPGNAEGDEEEEVSHLVPPAGLEGGRVYFELYELIADRYQGVLLPQPAPLPELPGIRVAGTVIGMSCAQALQNQGIPLPAGLTSRVWVDSAPIAADVVARASTLTAAQRAPFLAAMNRIIVRTCLIADRSVQFLTDEMVLPAPLKPGGGRRPAPVTLRWQDGDASTTLYGTANGAAVTIYVNPGSDPAFLGAIPATTFATSGTGITGFSGWNLAPTGSTTTAGVRDALDTTIVHELFHWFEFNADLNPAGWGSYLAFGEGAATAVQDSYVDRVRDRDYALPPLWSTSMFVNPAPPGQMRYQAGAFWRFLDWTAPPPYGQYYTSISILLNKVRTLAAARPRVNGLPDTQFNVDLPMINDAIVELFQGTSTGFGAAFVDFAAQILFEHNFEHPIPNTLTVGDRYKDRDGQRLNENGIGELWGAFGPGMVPSVNTLITPVFTSLDAPANAPNVATATITIPASRARALILDLSPWTEPGELTVRTWTTAGSAGQKAFLRRTGAPVAPRPSVPVLGTTEALATQERVTSSGPGSGGDLLVILANPSATAPTTIQVQVSASVVEPGLAVVASTTGAAQGSLSLYDIQGTAAVATTPLVGNPTGVALGTGAWGAALDPDQGILFLIDQAGSLRLYDSNSGAGTELDADNDPNTTSPGAPAGISRVSVGADPRGVAVVYDAIGEPYVVVTTAAGFVVVDGTSMSVIVTIPWASTGLPAGLRIEGLGYAYGSNLLFGAPRYPNSLQVTSNVYAWPVLELIYWPATPISGMVTLTTQGCLASTPVVSPDEAHVAFPCLNDRVVRTFSVPAGTFEGTLNPPGITQTDSPPMAVAWSSDSSWVYAAYLSGQIAGPFLGTPVARRCQTVNPFDCGPEVGFGSPSGSGSAIAVTGTGGAELIWLGDSAGGVSRATGAQVAAGGGVIPALFDVGDASIEALVAR